MTTPELVGEIPCWQDGARFDWLHPSYGVFPNLCLVYRDNLGDYTVAIWNMQNEEGRLRNRWTAAACGPDCYHQGQLQSYLWKQDLLKSTKFFCQVTKERLAYVDVETEPTRNQILFILADHTLKVLCRQPVDPSWPTPSSNSATTPRRGRPRERSPWQA